MEVRCCGKWSLLICGQTYVPRSWGESLVTNARLFGIVLNVNGSIRVPAFPQQFE